MATLDHIMQILPPNVKQIAFGIGSVSAYPDLIAALDLTRSYGVIPNITVNGDISDNDVTELVKRLGAVAVSYYGDDICFNAVKKFTDAGLRQTNIHCILSEQTFDNCCKLIEKASNDTRLSKLNAIVFLQVKPKGKHNTLTPLRDINKYKMLVKLAQENHIGIGFDGCSAPLAFHAIDSTMHAMIEPCESTSMSFYVNSEGIGFPCSFTEGTTSSGNWADGIDLNKVTNFLKEVWYAPRVIGWRSKVHDSSKNCNCEFNTCCRSCPVYNITPCNSRPELDQQLVTIS
jgi:hypothetical protein